MHDATRIPSKNLFGRVVKLISLLRPVPMTKFVMPNGDEIQIPLGVNWTFAIETREIRYKGLICNRLFRTICFNAEMLPDKALSKI